MKYKNDQFYFSSFKKNMKKDAKIHFSHFRLFSDGQNRPAENRPFSSGQNTVTKGLVLRWDLLQRKGQHYNNLQIKFPLTLLCNKHASVQGSTL